MSVPNCDYSDVPSDRRAYVFTACGHVFAFSPSLVGTRCPLCRTDGPFRPVAFSFDVALDVGLPTHVFNPCGHVASLDFCRRWADTPLLDVSAAGTGPGQREVLPPGPGSPCGVHSGPCCPFCGVPLCGGVGYGGPAYTKLVLQCDQARLLALAGAEENETPDLTWEDVLGGSCESDAYDRL